MHRLKPRPNILKNVDPNQLADEFDPALVSLFDHEGFSDLSYNQDVMNCCGQYYDMLAAYFYAKETVLPFIRQHGIAAVKPAQMIEWLKQAHQRMAFTLGEMVGFESGAYASRRVIRWQWGSEAKPMVSRIIGGEDEYIDALRHLANENHVSREMQNKIIALLKKIRNMKKLKHIDGKGYIYDPSDLPLLIGQTKLLEAYNKLLSPEELGVLKEVAIICKEPSEYPAAMDKFAKDLLDKWQKCSVSNDEEFSDLLLHGFNLAEIHPFANGNGRVSTWLMNVIARSFNKPSFLMRNQGEKQIATSSYSIAIKNIGTDASFFKVHVLSRIAAAEERGRIEYKTENDLAFVRCKTYQLMQLAIVQQSPQMADKLMTDSLTYMTEQIKKYPRNGEGYNPESLLRACTFQYSYLQVKMETMPTISSLKSTTLFADQSSSIKYNQEQKVEIVEILQFLSGRNDWKAYKGGTTMLLTLDNREKSHAIVSAMSNIEGITVKANINKNTQQPVVSVTEIQLDKLREYKHRLERGIKSVI